MHTDDNTDPLVELGYEKKDVDAKRVFKYTVGFFVFAFVAWFGTYFVYWKLGYAEAPPNVNNLVSSKLPSANNPRLQTNITAKTDIRDMRKAETELLTTSGDSTLVKGAQRIPIEQAIKLTAERAGRTTTAQR
ncbi:MAG: hypothetical protein IT203_02880 [Fimbriimonadaceae bacterium]|nr:hypothetical protein [Fimbriimonadaceae bacterium]